MLNHVVLVGRLVRNPELELTDTGKKRSVITLAVSRGYKNPDGEYETDFFDCVLWTGIAESTSEYCKTGDLIGVKGRLQTWILENEDGSKFKKVEVVAEKVTFLSSVKNVKDNSQASEEVNEVTDEITTIKESEKKYNKKKK